MLLVNLHIVPAPRTEGLPARLLSASRREAVCITTSGMQFYNDHSTGGTHAHFQPVCGVASGAAGDPHFTGAHDDKFDFKGKDDTIYNLLSAPNVTVSAR
jgi:hypothetical protein